MKRVLFIGLSLGGNKGGPAIYASLVGLLRKYIPDIFPVLVSTNLENDLKYKDQYDVGEIIPHPDWNLNQILYFPSVLRKSYNLYQGADLVIDMTGVKFIGGQGIRSSKTHLRSASHLIFPVWRDIPVVAFTQTYGPFVDRFTRWIARQTLSRVALLYARDQGSMNELRSIGLEQHATQYPDVAFTLPSTALDQINCSEAVKEFINDLEPFVGISVSNKIIQEEKKGDKAPRYEQLITEFMQELIREGHRILLVPHSYHPAQSADDYHLTQRLYQKVEGNKQCLMIEDDLTPQELKTLIGRSKVFIGSRYHSLIAALSSNIPSLSVGWNYKYDGLFSLFDMEQFCFHTDTVTLEELHEAFDILDKQSVSYSKKIQSHLPTIIEKVDTSVKNISTLLQ